MLKIKLTYYYYLSKKKKFIIKKKENSGNFFNMPLILWVMLLAISSCGVEAQNIGQEETESDWYKDSVPPPSSLIQNSKKAFGTHIQNEYETITNRPDINAQYKPPIPLENVGFYKI